MKSEIVCVNVPIRKKDYKVIIRDMATEKCTVEFVYNKKHFIVNEVIPNEEDSFMLTMALSSLLKAEIHRYNLARKSSQIAHRFRKANNIPYYSMPEE